MMMMMMILIALFLFRQVERVMHDGLWERYVRRRKSILLWLVCVEWGLEVSQEMFAVSFLVAQS